MLAVAGIKLLRRINFVRFVVADDLAVEFAGAADEFAQTLDGCVEKALLARAAVGKGRGLARVAHATDATDWRTASLSALTNHIVDKHHTFMKRELPRLGEFMDKVLGAHGENHPELTEVASVFAALRLEIEGHLMKEEQVLFPMIQKMEITREVGSAHCGSVNNPIGVMEHEHDNAGEALRRLRVLTGDYTPPADGCPTYQALLAGLAAMERDLHEHIHKENNILHPRAARLETALLAAAQQES